MREKVLISLGVVALATYTQGTYFLDAAKRLLFNQGMDRKRYDAYEGRYRDNLTISDQDTTDAYYDLATDFYEYGWGSSFHFAARFKGESFRESIRRHEYFLASKLQVNPGSKVLDLGMGVGGPLRAIAQFTGASITGVTLNDYQIRRARRITMDEMDPEYAAKCCRYIQGDYTNLREQLPENGTFDAVYYIESSCHLYERAATFKEAFRLLKPGGRLVSYEWVMTDKYDENNPTHVAIRKGIEHGNGLPTIISMPAVVEHLSNSGFTIKEVRDLAVEAAERYGSKNSVWYGTLTPGFSIDGFVHTGVGRAITRTFIYVLETIGLAAKGSVETEAMLSDGAVNLELGGQHGIFSPMYMVVAQKPE